MYNFLPDLFLVDILVILSKYSQAYWPILQTAVEKYHSDECLEYEVKDE